MFQGRRLDGLMGAIAPINFEKSLIASIDFRCKKGFLKSTLQLSIEILY